MDLYISNSRYMPHVSVIVLKHGNILVPLLTACVRGLLLVYCLTLVMYIIFTSDWVTFYHLLFPRASWTQTNLR